MTLTHLSLCTGIGGIDLAAEWAGFTTVGQCEIDEYASRVLAKNFKGVPNLHDIRTVDNARLRAYGIEPENITLLSAGFPCQPYSLAGKGRGDGDKRDLWGEVKRCIGEIGPRWFVGENTPGLFARAGQRYFKRILSDLAEMGYSVSWGIWGAVDVGAPHERKRVFICAFNTASNRCHEIGVQNREPCKTMGKASLRQSCRTSGTHGNIPNTVCERGVDKQAKFHATKGRESALGNTIELCNILSDATCDGIRKLGGTQQTERVAGRQCDNRDRTKTNAIWQWWETEPDVGRVANGVSARVDKLRCLGNAVVPYQIYPLLQAIADYENGRCK